MTYESISKLKKYMQKKIDAIVTGEKVTFNINAHQLLDEINEMERKARAFDNYMVDLAMAIQTYRNDYDKHKNFSKETYEFYMQSKEEFIESYNNVDRHHETIDSVEEYDKIISDLEDE